MLRLWFKRHFKHLFRSFSRRQKNPTTLLESLEKGDRTSRKKIVIVSCMIFTIFYILCYRRMANDFAQHIDFTEYEYESDENFINDTNGNPVNIDKAYTNGVDVLYRGLTRAIPTIKPRQFSQRDNLPKCISTYVNTTVNIKKIISETENSEEIFSSIDTGGHFIPPDCRPLYKVIILVPIRGREEQLRVFLYNMHPFLMQQKLEYRIVVIEQSGTEPFNRGRLFNVGFREIQMMGDYQCVVFHDVDLLPTDYRISYSCPILPRHLSASIIEEELLNLSTCNKTRFNGVTAMTMWQYREVNGYSNFYWGGYGEDEDMLKRLQASGLGVTSYKKTVGRYTLISNSSHTSPERIDNELLKTAVERYKKDGFSNLRYDKLSYAARHLYTKILVDIHPSTKNKPIL